MHSNLNPERKYKVAIIGGGAAGFFCAAQLVNSIPASEILIIEKDARVLQKVKVSGGGRCNLTHKCSDIREFVKNYPRGEKELLGPFNNFSPIDTYNWFTQNGVNLKTEADGRIFPVSDNSQTVIDCLLINTIDKGVVLHKNCEIKYFEPEKEYWKIRAENETFYSEFLVITCGGNKNFMNILANKTGHKIISPIPSLFGFDSKDAVLKSLEGISLDNAELKIHETKFSSNGAILITHKGISGPAVLKLSSMGARWLFEKNYNYYLTINWNAANTKHHVLDKLLFTKKNNGLKTMLNINLGLPLRLWKNILNCYFPNITNTKISEIKDLILEKIAEIVVATKIQIEGKSTNKDEFVTSGGVSLAEIEFKTFQSKIHNNLFFAGEILNIDAFTGGYNFQAAWTGAYIASKSIIALNNDKNY